jgi:Pyruvate/2-oxoacid:ferredoxin oxidoreductase delta subunit
LTLVTGAVKNLFGLTPKAERTGLHMIPSGDEFARCLLDLHAALPIHERVVMDGILGMDGEGPSAGRPRQLRAVVVADDPVLADWAMCHMMGIDWELTPLSHVVPVPDGTLAVGDLTPIQPAFARPRSYMGGAVVSIAATFQRIVGASNRPIPVVDTSKCIKCGICAQRCPAKAIRLAQYPQFNRRTCVLCYCCHEMCPQQAIVLRHTFRR